MPSNIQSHIQMKTDQIHGAGVIDSMVGVTGGGNAMTLGATNASAMEYVSIHANIIYLVFDPIIINLLCVMMVMVRVCVWSCAV